MMTYLQSNRVYILVGLVVVEAEEQVEGIMEDGKEK